MELRHYFQALLRRRWAFLLPVIGVPVMVLVLLLVSRPVYQCSGKVLVQTTVEENGFITDLPETLGSLSLVGDEDSAMATFNAIMGSDRVVGRVVRDLGIKDREGNPYPLNKFVNPGRFRILTKRQGVKITRVGKSNLIEVTAFSPTRDGAKSVATAVVERFREIFSEMNRDKARSVRLALEARVPEAGASLRDMARKVAEWESSHQATGIDFQQEELITLISQLEQTRLEAWRLEIESLRQVDAIRNGDLTSKDGFSALAVRIEDTSTVVSFKKELLDYESKLVGLLVDNTEEHPEVKAVKAQIAAIERQIKEEMNKTLASSFAERDEFFNALIATYSSAAADAVAARARREAVAGQIEKKQEELAAMAVKNRGGLDIRTELAAKTDSFTRLITDWERAGLSENLDVSNAIVISPPTLSSVEKRDRYFPPESPLFYLVFAFAVGCFLGVGSAFFMDYIDDRVWDLTSAEQLGNLPVLSALSLESRREGFSDTAQEGQLGSAIANILACAQHRKAAPVLSLAFVAMGRKSSCPEVVVETARFLASQKRNVLVVDADTVGRDISRMANLSGKEGVSEWLVGSRNARDFIQGTACRGVSVLPTGRTTESSAGFAFAPGRLAQLLAECAPGFTAILISLPAFSERRDALLASGQIDALIAVVERGKTKAADLEIFSRAFGQGDKPPVGMVLVDAR